MQSPNTVKLADVSPDTREEIKIYLSTLKLRKCTLDGKKVKTIEDAILFAKKEAEKVPSLEKENSELRAEIHILEKDKGMLVEDLQKAKEKVPILEKRIKELEKRIQEDREMRG